jgi:hypothetical protein
LIPGNPCIAPTITMHALEQPQHHACSCRYARSKRAAARCKRRALTPHNHHQEHPQQPQPALLYDLHDQLIPYEQVKEFVHPSRGAAASRGLLPQQAVAVGGHRASPVCHALQAWSWQKQRVAELCATDTQDRRDTVFLLQHPPLYTLGAGSSEAHIKFDLQQPPHPLFRTERGGEVTYHGPGQVGCWGGWGRPAAGSVLGCVCVFVGVGVCCRRKHGTAECFQLCS